MTPESLLHAMCQRHGLPQQSGQPHLSLIRKALKSPLEIRNRILLLVDGNLAERARGEKSEERGLGVHDDELLKAIARVMHSWTPSASVLGLGHLNPEGEGSES